MNEREVSELRRRLRPEKNNITHICGCFVNEKREVVSLFSQSLTMMPQEEAEAYLSLLKRTLSGGLGKNLIDISFTTRQVADSDEHRLLMALRDSELRDREVVQTFCRKIMDSLTTEGGYLILLARDVYDVPHRSDDGERQDDQSDEVFTYLVCAICPVKAAKPTLSYSMDENVFHTREGGWVAAAPEAGFLFPAFDQRATNLYNALYYSRDTADSHPELVDALFRTQPPMPAAVQKETFQTILGDTLAEECSYEAVQSVHDNLRGRIEAHKESRSPDPLTVSREDLRDVLRDSGVSEDHVSFFEQRYEAAFGADTDLSPKNLVDDRQFEIKTPDVTIKVNPDRSDLIETRVINGTRYILICADEGVEVNGVPIRIDRA
ncbi:DUF4317 domain-containing protein [Dysosmobacter sp.]|uniref:DUF4317 domain-containing protein n=1 Tax=Dysosmobacter sp. TaxID=2591382 RepID=UPI002A845879|nr:DUF4317 domain-containing protein [Dysosmobacter sp.]MDY3282195.1 DUF4317 domain-containing protein [Dysosmobacter sp.]